jgi:signal transduction histidine kinase
MGLAARPPLLAGVLVLAVIVAALIAGLLLGAPMPDVQQLAVILLCSGTVSLGIGTALMRWGGRRWAGLQLRLTVAWAAGLLVAAVNVVTASALMFINSHDRALLLLLLGFAAVISLLFGYGATGALLADLDRLGRTARRLAEGDLGARVGLAGDDELGRLVAAFDQMAGRLQSSFERERTLEASRRELVAAVSHDLRTPLTTIQAMVEAVADGVVADPAEVQRYLGLIRGEVQHLGRLIDDLFELSQLDSGALRLRLAPTPLPALLVTALAPYQARADDGGIRLEQQTEPGLPAVQADAARLQRVLRNLIDNALQHTPPGGTVRVDVRAAAPHAVRAPLGTGPPSGASPSPRETETDTDTETGTESPSALVTVSDSGSGIAREDAERVFERFYRGARARPRPETGGAVPGRATGAGLGLAIARGLVQAHGGRIWTEPAPGGGAVFRFTIPFAGVADLAGVDGVKQIG